MTIGIYKLVFKGTNKVYIGQSRTLEVRLQQHINAIKQGTASKKMTLAFSDFGTPTLEILTTCKEEELNSFETETIEIYDSVNNGFNTCSKGPSGYFSIHGEEHWNSRYTDEQIVLSFNLLVDNPEYRYTDIEEITGVSSKVITNIALLIGHRWLKNLYPDKYKLLENLKESRISGNKLTAKSTGKIYPPVISPEGIIYSNIDNIRAFASEHSLHQSHFGSLLNGKTKSHKGWKIA